MSTSYHNTKKKIILRIWTKSSRKGTSVSTTQNQASLEFLETLYIELLSRTHGSGILFSSIGHLYLLDTDLRWRALFSGTLTVRKFSDGVVGSSVGAKS